jgi:Ca-activated chloride channel homolog
MPLDQSPYVLELQHPVYLAALALLPLVVLISYRTLAGLGPGRGMVARGVRCVVVAVLALALAGPQWVRTTDDQTVVFALDQSDSIPAPQRQLAQRFVAEAAASLRPGQDRVASLRFARAAVVDQLPRERLVVRPEAGVDQGHQTDLAAALRLGLALMPADTAKRLVLLSDGHATRGLAAEEAAQYAALGIPIDVVPLRYTHEAEVFVDQVVAPATAQRDQMIRLQVVIQSTRATAARLQLERNGQRVALDSLSQDGARRIALQPGPNRVAIPIGLSATGVHRFRVTVATDDPEADSQAANNTGRAVTVVGAPTRVLVASDSGSPDPATDRQAAAILVEALRSEGIDCELVTVDQLPDSALALNDTAAVVLSNVSAVALGSARQALLARYVRDQGGGLVVLGGDQSFSVGGYANTELEAVLPVETERDKLNLPSLGMVIVIDRSGSMAGEKLQLARRAAVEAVQMLSRRDRVGVVAFDGSPSWLVRLQVVEKRAAIARQLARLESGGGTNLFPAMEQALAALAAADTNLKHMIVLTDGRSTPGHFGLLADQCRQRRISVSTIAVGPDADQALLAEIAQRSGGRMYVADRAQRLPQIFARETILASRSGLFEQAFRPLRQPTMNEQIVQGLDPEAIPPLDGHVLALSKELAQTPLVRQGETENYPILAYWQVGLGRTVAFTSGLWPKWGREWVAWPGFAKLWTQALRYAARAGNPAALEVATRISAGTGEVTVSARHLPPVAQRSLTLAGSVVGPDGEATPLTLRPTDAGRYAATFPAEDPGAYLVHLPYQYRLDGRSEAGAVSTGVVQSYSPEYRHLEHHEGKLAEIARQTGGRVLNADYPAAVFEPWSIRPTEVRRPIWDVLVRVALLLFILDVAVRRIALTPGEAARNTREYIRGLAGARPSGEQAATLGALRDAKGRARAGVEAPEPANAPPPSPVPKRGPSAASQHAAGADLEHADAQPADARPADASTETDAASSALARLRQAKQRAREKGSQSPDS